MKTYFGPRAVEACSPGIESSKYLMLIGALCLEMLCKSEQDIELLKSYNSCFPGRHQEDSTNFGAWIVA